jgi:hypothetical protein
VRKSDTDYSGGKTDGTTVEQLFNGKKRQVLKNGVYEGDFVDGVFHGKGKFTYHNYDVYEGDYVNGKPHGKGKFTEAENVYEGDFAEGKRTGKGKLTFKHGSFYEGDFVDGVPTGKDSITYPDGRIERMRNEE